MPTAYEGYICNDETHIVCPRARTTSSLCVARDGVHGCGDTGYCVGCSKHPAELLKQLVSAITEK